MATVMVVVVIPRGIPVIKDGVMLHYQDNIARHTIAQNGCLIYF